MTCNYQSLKILIAKQTAQLKQDHDIIKEQQATIKRLESKNRELRAYLRQLVTSISKKAKAAHEAFTVNTAMHNKSFECRQVLEYEDEMDKRRAQSERGC